MDKPTHNYRDIAALYARKKHVFFSAKPYDLNLFGIRAATTDQTPDRYDDYLGCAWVDENNLQHVQYWPATTDPGKDALINPRFYEAQRNGTAILVPGQYRAAYELGRFGTGHWSHTALMQVRPVRIYRDNNRDAILDFDTPITEGMYGICIHASVLYGESTAIGLFSAGCQVFRAYSDYRECLRLCQQQIAHGLGNSFTYTLFTEGDFV
jgi:hypothetical protein